MSWKKIFYRVITILLVVVVVGLSLYIMWFHLGLNPEMDFGAGAYYYADIPNFEELTESTDYQAKLPYWVYVALFLAWGYLMFRFWKWVDRH